MLTPEASCTHNIEVPGEPPFSHSPLAQSDIVNFSTDPSQAGLPGARIAGDQAASLGRQRRLEPDRGAAQRGATPLLSSPYPPGPAPTTIFPVPFPNNIVVVVVSIGSSRLVVIVPITTTSHSLVASNSHPVQFETPSPVSLPAPTPSTLNSFGQLSTVDSLSWRTSRFGSEDEVAALIDVVEPFQAPVPAVAPNKAATPFRTGATVMLPAGGLPHLPRLDRGAGRRPSRCRSALPEPCRRAASGSRS